MDGRNCTGRKISLLNEGGDVVEQSHPQHHYHKQLHQQHHHQQQQQQQQHHDNNINNNQNHPRQAYPRSISTSSANTNININCEHRIQLPSLTAHHSRASSCASTPSLSPQTPHLVRSSSSDSRAFQTPSPLTPSFTPFPSSTQLPSITDNNATAHALQFPPQKLSSTVPHHPDHTAPSSAVSHNHHHHHHHHHHPHSSSALHHLHHHHHRSAPHYFFLRHASSTSTSSVTTTTTTPTTKMDDPDLSLYPPIPDVTAISPSAYAMTLPMQLPPTMSNTLVMPQPQSLQPHHPSNSPSSEPSHVSAVSGASNAKTQPKKNQYPCPLAKQVGCNDFFTTSGHAARHAKKHTGKKDAFCPECNKAFTRKDNMEQHRRTHQNGRGANRLGTSDDGKVKKTTKTASRKVTTKVEPQQLEAAVQQELAEQEASLLSQATLGQPIAPQQILPQPSLIDAALMIPPSASGPYYLGPTIDSGPIPPLPMAIQDLSRPMLQRNSYTNNLEYMAPPAPMLTEDALHYSYPSPGLSNGLNSLALAASEHRRLTEEKSLSSRSPSQETPTRETP